MKAFLGKFLGPQDSAKPKKPRTGGLERAHQLIEEGNALEDKGRIRDAKGRYDAAVDLAPEFSRGYLNLGNALFALGEFDSATEAFRTAIKLEPEYAAPHYNLGNAYIRAGRHTEARDCYEEAIRLKPEFADARIALGVVLEDQGLVAEAVSQFREAIKARPDYAEAYFNLGTALHRLRDLDGAIAALQTATSLKPELGAAHSALAISLEATGRLDEAEASYRKVLALDPRSPVAHNNLANVLARTRRLPEAIEQYRRALELDPRYADALGNLANAYHASGNVAAAELHYRRSLEIRPESPEVHSNLGNLLKDQGQFQQAIECYARALQINPDFAEIHYNLANTLQAIGMPIDAIASYQRALKLDPQLVDAHGNLGNALKDLGRLDEAVATYRNALTLKPDFAMAYSNRLFCLTHNEQVNADALFREHLGFGERFEAPLRHRWTEHRNSRDPDRILRVGFVSGDLRNHPVAFFFEPLLEHLSGRSGLRLYAYHSSNQEDAVSERLHARFHEWRNVHDASDDALVARILEDQIDILVDLSGHTAENRLLAFARKPAPLQASWIGYPGTTGLAAMDYYLTDPFLLPVEPFGVHFTEKLVHLPASGPFRSDPSAPPPNALPALSNGWMTFGTFNRPSKLRAATVKIWTDLLRELPDSRMLVAGMTADGQYDWVKTMFARNGIPMDRLTFVPRCTTAEYLALHHKVDICLDTFPYSSGTTANHALWMGVPTLTIAGTTPPGRQGTANMLRAGLPGFVARDAGEFVELGVKWSNDLPGLAEVRASGRGRVQHAPWRQPHVIAAGLHQALREMWRRWCSGLPPEYIDVSQFTDERSEAVAATSPPH